ncbi:unnamed protein product [Kuraishia capsulata CBS 1993]|uniref:SH3 domain-containing protein n=1 Tax=Kuraishia capsulata CBS 1993 TaxID=1382522 RepID=W6MJV9_9ASCO|nr:uncharacterized protein KUCA_T00000789001 [Kuraishia capsulata CBS 1993]CDK24822.1 unnamed protein product [Kuraishia capsulata CBS 1993]
MTSLTAPFEVVAAFTYASDVQGDLPFVAGDIIVVDQVMNADWYKGHYTKDGSELTGIFPTNYVQVKPDSEEKTEAAVSGIAAASTGEPESEQESPIESFQQAQHDLPEPSAPEVVTESASKSPSAFKDRISTFNLNSAPPPLPSNSRKEAAFTKKPVIAQSHYVPPGFKHADDHVGVPAPIKNETSVPPQPVSPVAIPAQDEEEEGPKLSLKERIAMLQKRQQEEAERQAAVLKRKQDKEQKKKERKKSVKDDSESLHTRSSIDTERVDLGESIHEEGKGHHRKSTTEFEGIEESDEDEIIEHATGEKADEKEVEDEDEEAEEDDDDDEDDEDDEEDEDEERRRALRERIAKMSGGMGMIGMMGMPNPMAGVPKPKPKAKKASEPEPESEQAPRPVPVMPFAISQTLPPSLGGPAEVSEEESEDEPPVPVPTERPPHAFAALAAEGVTESPKSVKKEVDDSFDLSQLHSDDEVPVTLTSAVSPSHRRSDSKHSSSSRSIPPVPILQSPKLTGRRASKTEDLSTGYEGDEDTDAPVVEEAEEPALGSAPPIPTSPEASRSAPPIPTSPVALHSAPPVPQTPRSIPPVPVAETLDHDDDDEETDSSDEGSVTPPAPHVAAPVVPVLPAVPPPAPAPAVPSVPAAPHVSHVPPIPRTSTGGSSAGLPHPPPPPPPIANVAPVPQVYSSPTSAPPAAPVAPSATFDTPASRSVAKTSLSGTWWLHQQIPPEFEPRIGKDVYVDVETLEVPKRAGKVFVVTDYYVLHQNYSQELIEVSYEKSDPHGTVALRQISIPAPAFDKERVRGYSRTQGYPAFELASGVLGHVLEAKLVIWVLSKLPKALPPVGNRTFGVTVYSNNNNTDISTLDDPRPGDIFCVSKGKFESRKKLQKHSYELGYSSVFAAVISEYDSSKGKFRVIEQDDYGKVRASSHRLSDLKSGRVRVFRIAERDYVKW